MIRRRFLLSARARPGDCSSFQFGTSIVDTASMGFMMKVPKTALLSIVAMMLLVPKLHGVYGFPDASLPGVGIQDDTGSDISVHCKSKDDDLGSRTMHNSDTWKWRFHPDFTAKTLYWCYFEWKTNGKTLSSSFVVWDVDVAPIYNFSIQSWKVKQDGFWLYEFVSDSWIWHHPWGIHDLAKVEDMYTERAHELVDGNDGL